MAISDGMNIIMDECNFMLYKILLKNPKAGRAVW